MTIVPARIARAVPPRRVSWRCLDGAMVVAVGLVALGPGGRAQAQAPAADPGTQAAAAVREMIARDLSPTLTVDDKTNDDRRFMSPDLYRLYASKRRHFDADPYTGTQDASDYTLVKLAPVVKSGAGVVVTIEFAVAGAPKSHPRLAYDMVLSHGRWLVQDIGYLADGTSLHNLLNGMR